MVNSKFYSNLTRFIKNQDNKNANKVIMTELATLLAKNNEGLKNLQKLSK